MAPYPGTRKRASWTVRNELTDALESPAEMTVEYGVDGDDPTTLTYPDDAAIVEDEEGTFHLDVDCATAGTWSIRVAATEGVIAVAEDSWVIRESAFAT